MEKYYLFGAGNNAWGVISFFGKENILAIIDNEDKKNGLKMKDIPIISFDQYLKEQHGEIIIITSAVFEEIIEQLEAEGITNYYVAPMIQMGMASVEQMISEWHLLQEEKLTLYGYNPIGKKIVRNLLNNRYMGKIEVIPQREIEWNWAINDRFTISNLEMTDSSTRFITFSSDDAAMLRMKNVIKDNILNVFDLMMESNQNEVSNLKKWKDVHKGEDCFIIGNGPSLRVEDLERIYRRGTATFGMNLIYKMYERTNWRPTYYVFAEYNMIRQYYDEIKLLRKDNLFIKNFFYMDDTPKIENVNYYPGCGERYYCEKQRFSEDISSVVYAGYSVMYDAIQIAIYMGYKNIFLLGADFSYLADPAQKGNHVYDDIVEDKRLIAGKPHIYITVAAMEMAKLCADRRGVSIYNVTRGGRLEVFPRLNIEDLI